VVLPTRLMVRASCGAPTVAQTKQRKDPHPSQTSGAAKQTGQECSGRIIYSSDNSLKDTNKQNTS